MISVADPVGLGLVASLAHPGGNVTGLAYTSTSGKELELLKEIIPEVRRVAILSNPGNTSNARAISNIEATARSLAVQLQLLEARAPNEFDAAFAAMAKERVGACSYWPTRCSTARGSQTSRQGAACRQHTG
jgi:putative ABC transport system substrate-binding protein